MSNSSVEQVIEKHRASGRYIDVEGVETFILEAGFAGKESPQEAVFCIHGVPTSSFLYRKVLPALATRGFRAIAVDLPGFGLSTRPGDFDYSFPSYARFCAMLAEALGLERFHLVVHDIGGPVGFGMAAELQEKILSLTILNTWIEVDQFEKPLPMRPFEVPVIGEAQLAALTHLSWYAAFKGVGVANADGIPKEEIYAYVDLLKREDGGKAFLKVMRNFDKSKEYAARCRKAVQNVPYPVQAIWGMDDPGLRYERYGKEVEQLARLAPEQMHQVNGSHLLQEEQYVAIAEKVAGLASMKEK
ncbi:alpha/beta fold hydrolase [Nafulsella turpanensis]|uniref:alpha/beta fold hydrolase n=1 Tax=Nafulsella turpanensis TaxID=1265690 RepID=UPI00034A2506|nr:alpha/beta hydrolase [Nafulsella turpanensis]